MLKLERCVESELIRCMVFGKKNKHGKRTYETLEALSARLGIKLQQIIWLRRKHFVIDLNKEYKMIVGTKPDARTTCSGCYYFSKAKVHRFVGKRLVKQQHCCIKPEATVRSEKDPACTKYVAWEQ